MEEALEDVQEAFSNAQKCLKSVGFDIPSLKRKLEKTVNSLTTGPKDSEDWVPPFPIGILLCSIVICVAGFMINSSWDSVDAALTVFEDKSGLFVKDFYASAAEANIEIKNTYSTQGFAHTRQAVTLVVHHIVNVVFIFCTFVAVLMTGRKGSPPR